MAVDAYSALSLPPPGPPAEFGWLLALAVLCAARLSRVRSRADQFRPELALVRTPTSFGPPAYSDLLPSHLVPAPRL